MILKRLFGSRDDEPAAGVDDSGGSTTDAPASAEDAADLMILEQLRAMGADLSKPREVLHYLYLPTREAGEASRARVEPLGYATEVREAAGPPGPNPWVCVATIEEVVSMDSVRAAREVFTSLAAEHGGEYDGWEAAGVP